MYDRDKSACGMPRCVRRGEGQELRDYALAHSPGPEPMMLRLWVHCAVLVSLLASEKHFSCAVTCLPSGCTFESLGCTYNKAWKDLDCMYNDIEGSIYVTNVPSETKRVFLKGNVKLTSIDARTYEYNDAEFLLDAS